MGDKRSTDDVDPELLPVLNFLRQAPFESIDSWWKVKLMNSLSAVAGPVLPGVNKEQRKGVGTYFAPVALKQGGSAVLYIHSGGRIMGHSGDGESSKVASTIANRLKVPVLSADYSLGCFPAALDDLVAAYEWLQEDVKAQAGGGENVRILVAGSSGGGGLAAELCQRLIEKSSEGNSEVVLPVAQLLMYPMLDDRTCNVVQPTEHFVWNNASNTYAWSQYLGPELKPGAETLPDFAAAARREHLSNLPPTWIAVGGLDLFADECRNYAARLKEHGVETEFLEVKGGFHAMMEVPIGLEVFGRTVYRFDVGQDEAPIANVWKSLEEFASRYLDENQNGGHSMPLSIIDGQEALCDWLIIEEDNHSQGK